MIHRRVYNVESTISILHDWVDRDPTVNDDELNIYLFSECFGGNFTWSAHLDNAAHSDVFSFKDIKSTPFATDNHYGTSTFIPPVEDK